MMSVVKWDECRCGITDVLEQSFEGRTNPQSASILSRWLKTSDEVWLGMYDDTILCMYGLATPSALSNRAYLWLLTTDALEEHKFLFIRHSQVVIEDALRRYDTIIGHVEIGNDPARKWLRWLGARIEEPVSGYSTFRIRRK